MSKAKVVPIKGKRCPVCGRPVQQEFRPFCSRRCADKDLGQWLTGAYRVPTEEAPDDAGGASERPDDDRREP